MRLFLLEDDAEVCTSLRTDLETLGHVVSTAPTVQAAQVALAAETFDFAVLSESVLRQASYSLADYIHVTNPGLPIILIEDGSFVSNRERSVDWILGRPLSSLELMHVIDYLTEDTNARKRSKSGEYTYVGSARSVTGRRNWVN